MAEQIGPSELTLPDRRLEDYEKLQVLAYIAEKGVLPANPKLLTMLFDWSADRAEMAIDAAIMHGMTEIARKEDTK